MANENEWCDVGEWKEKGHHHQHTLNGWCLCILCFTWRKTDFIYLCDNIFIYSVHTYLTMKNYLYNTYKINSTFDADVALLLFFLEICCVFSLEGMDACLVTIFVVGVVDVFLWTFFSLLFSIFPFKWYCHFSSSDLDFVVEIHVIFSSLILLMINYMMNFLLLQLRKWQFNYKTNIFPQEHGFFIFSF